MSWLPAASLLGEFWALPELTVAAFGALSLVVAVGVWEIWVRPGRDTTGPRHTNAKGRRS